LRIAVTGASGFLGKHVLKSLSEHDVEIVGTSHKNTALINDLFPKVSCVRLDIHNFRPDIFAALGRPDVLIHLAWGGLPNYQSTQHLDIELPAQYKFLKHMIDSGLPALLVTGTCLEYGMRGGPLSQDLMPQPNTLYAHAKSRLLELLQKLQNERQYNLTWARLFYIYGDGQSETSLYTSLKKAVSNGERYFNMSRGEQLRDYLPARAVADQLTYLAINRCFIKLLNICSGTPISVKNLVKTFIDENNWKINLNLGYYPYPDYEPMAFWGIKHPEMANTQHIIKTSK
jgi:nucleoside-diphosphate-sugar epimerase